MARNLSHFYEEPVRLGVERAGNISLAFWCAYGVLILGLKLCPWVMKEANGREGFDDAGTVLARVIANEHSCRPRPLQFALR